MAIHHLTPPIRGGERPRLPSTQGAGFSRRRESVHKVDTSTACETLHNMQTFRPGGPVTQAIRAMRSAEPVTTETISVLSEADEAIAAIREGVMRFLAQRIERDIALLDALDGDADAECSLGSIDATAYSDWMSQERWSLGGGQDREAGDDNGLGDHDALSEQGFPGYGRCA